MLLGFYYYYKDHRNRRKKGNKRTKPVSFQDMLILPFHSPTLQCFAHEKQEDRAGPFGGGG